MSTPNLSKIILSCGNCENKKICPQYQRTQNPEIPCSCIDYSKHSQKIGIVADITK